MATIVERQGYSKEELIKEAEKQKIPRSLIHAAIQFGHIKPGYPLPKYLEEAIQDPKDPNKSGYETVVNWAVQGSGKSNFLMQTGYWIYGDWEKVLNNIIFTPKEFHRHLRRIPQGKRIPWIGWDDMGVHHSNLSYRTNVKMYEIIGQLWHAIRTKANIVVISIPVIDHLPKNVKDNVTFEVYIGKNQNVLIRRWFRLPSTKPNKDSFLIRLPIEPIHKIDLYQVPTDVFARYWALRLKLADRALDEMEKVMDLVDETEGYKPPGFTEFLEIARNVGLRGDTVKFHKFWQALFPQKKRKQNNNIIKEDNENE